MDVSKILRAVLRVSGWSQEELADRLKTTQATISRWLDGREPKGRNMDAIRALALEFGLIDEATRQNQVVAVMGRIGAGAEILPEFEQVPADGLEQVELPLSVPEGVIGFRVKGDSMWPRYDADDVVLVHRDQQHSTGSLIGREAAVRTRAGHRYLKRIMRGPKPNTFNLESFNARTIEGARIAWASPIIIVVKAEHLRRAGKKEL